MAKSVSAPVKIHIGGNVENGNIVVGDNNFVVNTNHGTIIHQQARPQVRLRDFAPQSPRAPRGFLNRADELRKLESWISSNEMVLIHGLDGMGKSSLLRQAANGQAGRERPNGVILLEGDNVSGQVLGTDDVIQRLFDALFESDPPLKVDANTARTYLSNTGPLLLFDEVPLSPTLQRALPDLFPNGSMLFTSDLAIGREDFLRLPLGPLPHEAAIRLLLNKAGLEFNEVNRAAVDSICLLLDDISLAVVIAGNVMRETGITLDDTLKYFQEISDPASAAYHKPTRAIERGLDRAFAYAFSRLKPEEQQILSAAALTPGASMTPEWLVSAFGSEEAEHFIERLKALGLLVANSPRLRVPAGIRISVRRASTLDEDSLLRSLADFLLASAEKEPQNWDFFSEELGNLFGTLTWTIQSKNWPLALRLGRALDPYLTLRGLWNTWQNVLDSLLEAARQSGNRAAEAFALHQSGVRELGVGARQRALELLRQALEIRRALGDTIGMAYTQHNIDFLIGPPTPPQDNQPKPQPPKPVPPGVKLLLLAGTVGAAGLIGLVLLGIIFGPIFFPPPTVRPETPIAPTTVVPPQSTQAPTSTPTPTPTPTPIIAVLAIHVTNSSRSDIVFLYQGSDFDYFEVPILIRINNIGVVNISDFDFSIRYEASDGSHPAQFRLDGENAFFDSQTGEPISTGELIEKEVMVMVPRSYEGTTIQLTISADRCQQDIECRINGHSVQLPKVVYDFIDSAPTAKWLGYDPNIEKEYNLKFNGPDADRPLGSAGLEKGHVLEDGSRPLYILATHPTWVPEGTVEGLYLLGPESLFLGEGDVLYLRYGFIGRGAGDGVTFHIDCLGPELVSATQFLNVYDSNDGNLKVGVIAFSDPIAECAVFSLWVDAGPTSDQDWAVWLSAYIGHH